MPRYVAFLRGVMPTNAKMADLRRCFESAGFTDARTVRSSGNVVFDASSRSEAAITRRAEAAMSEYPSPPNSKRIVTFLRDPVEKRPSLPLCVDGARILALEGREVFSTYVPDPRGPSFMVLLEKTFGTNITTRTWETVQKCAVA